jgi:tetratricopeptide (TPR) repeat protein
VAQSIDQALELFEDKDYEEAAFAFYDVLQHDESAQVRDQAEIYLAESLRKLSLYFPALFYYSDLLKAGASTRYYLKAVEGLLEVQKELHDPLFVPTLVNANFDPQNFGKLPADKIAQINYLIGELSARKRKDDDARAFLQYVAATSPLYAKARYLLGIVDVRAGNMQGALTHFKAIVDAVDPDDANEELRRVRNLSLLALGRASYSAGKFQQATHYYKSVPRFSMLWFDALYENAWAHFSAGEYGNALGELQSVTSPYFAKRHIPEAYVVQGTTYFVNCQWDRVRAAVSAYRALHAPMTKGLEQYLDAELDAVARYRDVVASGNGHFAPEMARQVRRTTRFKDYHFMLEHLAWERDAVRGTDVWKRSRLAEDLGSRSRSWTLRWPMRNANGSSKARRS